MVRHHQRGEINSSTAAITIRISSMPVSAVSNIQACRSRLITAGGYTSEKRGRLMIKAIRSPTASRTYLFLREKVVFAGWISANFKRDRNLVTISKKRLAWQIQLQKIRPRR